MRKSGWVRSVVALYAAVLVLATGLVAPLLEEATPASAVLESQHEPGQCPNAHDHGLCIQLQQSRSTLADAQDFTPGVTDPDPALRTNQVQIFASIQTSLLHARAPPVV